MSKCVDAEAERGGEGLLRKTEFRADLPDVHAKRDMHAVTLLRASALGELDGLFEATPDAACDSAHRLRLLYVSTRTLVSRRNALRFFCERSARSFFANTVRANKGMSSPAKQ